jgi:F-type H+-transporting ATPase subunit epsilon
MAAKNVDLKKLRLRIVTPEEIKFDENVDMVIMRCTTGDMGILHGHEPRSAVLSYGALRILNGGNERRLAVFGGLAEVQNNLLTILTNLAEWPDEIDRARAELDFERAERHMRERIGDLEIQSDQVQLRRAMVRIEVSSYVFTGVSNHE